MDIFFNYLKPYITNDCKIILHNDLIPGKKYLIKFNDNKMKYYIGTIFINWSDDNSVYRFSYYNNNINIRKIHMGSNFYKYYFYELVDDFSFNHCNDLIQSYYFINDAGYDTSNIINDDKYIYAIKNNNIIYIIDYISRVNIKNKLNNIFNPFLNNNYNLQLNIINENLNNNDKYIQSLQSLNIKQL